VSLSAEKAAAARWLKAKAEQLPPEHRPDVAEEWGRLLHSIEDTRSDGAAVMAILEWRQEMAEKLSATLAHAPLAAFERRGSLHPRASGISLPDARKPQRTCPKCGETKPETGFAKDASKASGRKSHCKVCDCERARRYYQERKAA
jgi:formate dehydrogenase maturation protein FdhE